MAVVALKSAPITNRDASPRVLNNPSVENGILREAVATIELANGDSIGSTYRMLSVPSNARVSSLKVFSDDIGTTTIADFGLYRSTADGGAVVSVSFFGSAVALSGGALNGTDITHESAVFDPDDVEKPLWSALGLSSDPNVLYDVVATLTAASDAAGTLSLKCQFVV